MRRPIRVLSVLLVSSFVIGAVTGCSILPWGKTEVVSDPTNLFHFKIPSRWQWKADGGFISVYADKQLPQTGEAPDALSLLVFTSAEASSAPLSEMVDYLVDARAKSRGWKDVKRAASRQTKLGGRAAYQLDVTATDADGATFESRYVFSRTGGKEVFLVAVAPDGASIADHDDEIGDVTAQWYWHIADGASQTATSTTSPQ